MRQHLLIDADDTLWENNIYFERAFARFCEYLDHSVFDDETVRGLLDEVELVNIRLHGYGSANFGRNMIECFHNLAERPVTAADDEHIRGIARGINDHALEILEGVPETLEYLASRHHVVMVTKGDAAEQTCKIDQSGLRALFCDVVILREKDAQTYRNVVTKHGMDQDLTWMIGNSPKSDINPAMQAGIGAVYVPHPRTWHLEHQEIVPCGRLHVVEKFRDLRRLF
ncbi:MAG: HAD family hydrolase [Candidatus Solibacter usitatus]|nr:HAD family hydrolase [Candidatus Solibacter usitatus]